ETPIRLPPFLGDVLGDEMTAAQLAREWRRVAALAREAISALGKLEVGQHVPAMKVIAAAGAGQDLAQEAARDPKLARFLSRRAAEEWVPHLRTLGCELPSGVIDLVQDVLARRAALLAERRTHQDRTPTTARLELAALDTQLLVLYAALVRRLWQR